MASKQEYEEGRAKKLSEQEQQERFSKLAKGATFVALNAAIAFFSGKAQINIFDFEQQIEGKPPLKGRSVRFQYDQPPKVEEAE